MRLTGTFLVLCVGLAALKAAASVMAIVLLGGLLVAGIARPAETLGFIAGCILLSLLGSHPWAAAAIILGLSLIKAAG